MKKEKKDILCLILKLKALEGERERERVVIDQLYLIDREI